MEPAFEEGDGRGKNKTSLTEPDGNVTTFAYSTLNEETLTTNPLGFKTTTTYNSNEQVSTVTDPDGREEIYSYDSNQQNTSVVWKNASGTTVNTLTYTYDSSGNVLTAANAARTYTMGYDADNRVTSVAGLFGVSLTYGYDAVGNRTTVQDSLGGTTTVVYNADNEWTTTEANGTGMSQMREDQSYTADSLPSTDIRYSNLTGTTKVGETDYSYNSNNDVTNITYKNGSSTVLQQVTYSYDQADRVTTQNLNATTSTYLYDAINELTSDSVHSYTYDPNGNRNSTGYSTGPGNELLNDGTYTYTYDNAGNLVEKSKGTGLQTWYYTYDNKNNLLTVNETSNGSTSIMTATYTYDVFGNMVAEVQWQTGGSAVTTEHVYDQQTGNLLLDLNSSNAVQMRYLSGNLQNEYLGREDGSGNTSWYLTDRLGSVIGLTDGSGTATDTIVYDGFGNMTSNSAPTVTGTIGFQGMFTDPATGQSGSGARQGEYNPTTGSWTNPDPSGLSSGSNPYEAMGNEPTNATDPSGLAEWSWKQIKELATNDLDTNNITGKEKLLRLKILESLYKCPVMNIGENRSQKLWDKHTDTDGTIWWSFKNRPIAAVGSSWIGEPSPDKIYCAPLAQLTMIKGQIALASNKQLVKWAELMKGVSINNIPGVGTTMFWEKLSPPPNPLLAGDNVWFINPYYLKLKQAGLDPQAAAYKGEQGSNVFYIGAKNGVGYVMTLYTHEVYTIAQYQRNMATWPSVKDVKAAGILSTLTPAQAFTINSVRRPLVMK